MYMHMYMYIFACLSILVHLYSFVYKYMPDIQHFPDQTHVKTHGRTRRLGAETMVHSARGAQAAQAARSPWRPSEVNGFLEISQFSWAEWLLMIYMKWKKLENIIKLPSNTQTIEYLYTNVPIERLVYSRFSIAMFDYGKVPWNSLASP